MKITNENRIMQAGHLVLLDIMISSYFEKWLTKFSLSTHRVRRVRERKKTDVIKILIRIFGGKLNMTKIDLKKGINKRKQHCCKMSEDLFMASKWQKIQKAQIPSCIDKH